MDAATVYLIANPFWAWIALGAVLLAIELGTGSGWLLWPSASAGVLAVLTAFLPIPPSWSVLIFALLTIATTYVGRRMIKPANADHEPDINDPLSRLVGHHGTTVTAFVNGAGRVFVDGKEWAAKAEAADTLTPDQKVQVTGVNGAILRVKPA